MASRTPLGKMKDIPWNEYFNYQKANYKKLSKRAQQFVDLTIRLAYLQVERKITAERSAHVLKAKFRKLGYTHCESLNKNNFDEMLDYLGKCTNYCSEPIMFL
ncbi:hypothetical protein GCK32_014492 [Trichostrongylus colubriformis]|uniref:Uncharacterized protein n=1 Tax=Trichostrongylus colubriformis TaxID=6319 RepID=A0AAN8G946_TRICO